MATKRISATRNESQKRNESQAYYDIEILKRVSLFLVDSEPASDLHEQFMQAPIFIFLMIPLPQLILKLLHEYTQNVFEAF